MTLSEIATLVTAAVACVALIGALVAYLLRVRAEISSIAGKVAQLAADVDEMHSRCAERYQWMRELTRTLNLVDKNQTRLAAMLGVDIDRTEG